MTSYGRGQEYVEKRVLSTTLLPVSTGPPHASFSSVAASSVVVAASGATPAPFAGASAAPVSAFASSVSCFASALVGPASPEVAAGSELDTVALIAALIF